MTKIRIIDLLNKIANGEEVPKDIKVNDKIYFYDGTDSNEFYRYRTHHEEELLTDYCDLDDEVEIIEDKQIEKLENKIEFYSYSKYEELKRDVDKILYILRAINLTETKICNLNNKLNELIDKVNSLEKNQ